MRKRLARENIRTVFNLLGPLLNPARPGRQLIGVFSPRLTTIFANALRQLGRERGWIVHGVTETGEGMDDISTSGVTTFAELANGKVTSGLIDPRWLNIPAAPLDELLGGDAEENAGYLEGILSGKIQGAKRDLTLVNAAGGFVVAGLCNDMNQGWTGREKRSIAGAPWRSCGLCSSSAFPRGDDSDFAATRFQDLCATIFSRPPSPKIQRYRAIPQGNRRAHG
jgi:Anthranilate phosphoribosyltransferase